MVKLSLLRTFLISVVISQAFSEAHAVGLVINALGF
jgi:hypothetical protein